MPTSAAGVSPLLRSCEAAVCGLLIAGQSVLLALLLKLTAQTAVALALLAGLPLAFACHQLLARFGHRRHLQLTVVMFAAGGFGLLLGCTADFGELGLYGLLSLCRSWSQAGLWPTLEQLSMNVSLMPCTWLGMVLGSNAVMAFDAWLRPAGSLGRALAAYGLCNAGMLLGMIVAERTAAHLTLELGQTAAALAMALGMVAGMVLGMNVLLAAAGAFKFLSASRARPPGSAAG